MGSVTTRTRLESLKGDRAFRRLRKGRSGGAKYLSTRWRPTHDEVVRVGIVVSGKVGNAVVRNRVRRRLREALRELVRARDDWSTDALHAGIPSFDLVVIARPEAADADYHQLAAALDRSLAKAALW